MEFIRRNHRLTLLTLLALALLFGGCASGGIFGNRDDKTSDNGGYDNGDYDRSDNDTYDRSNDRISEVRGRVDRVDTADQIVWVEASGVSRNNLRNTNDDKIALHYDDQTRVEYEGKTYEPRALEEGDRIVADVDDTGSRLYARDIEVTYDVTQGDQNDRSADSDRSNDRSNDDSYDRSGSDRNEVSQLRGTVRWVDQDRRVMELENTSWGFGSNRDRTNRDDVVQVYYDGNTVVEYNGKRYQPSSLERGDEVEIDLRTASGSRYTADEIQVVANVRD